MLARISQLGAMDKNLAKPLISAHCRRGAEFLRRKQWQPAENEFKTAERKFAFLDKTESEVKENRKLRAICQAGCGVAQLMRDDCAAAKSFRNSRELIGGMVADDRVSGNEDDLLAQLLRVAVRKRTDESSVDSSFARDVSFLGGHRSIARASASIGGARQSRLEERFCIRATFI